MRVLITGGGGQAARALADDGGPNRRVLSLSRAELDIADADAVAAVTRRERPDIMINAAAFTWVDRAQREPEAAWRVNHSGAANLGRAAQALGARMVHLSTDYVFGGGAGRPARPEDPPAPLNVYGASKLAGEIAVQDACASALIVRTAWLYSAGPGNFLSSMLRKMAAGEPVRVVDDQLGTPTSVRTLSKALWGLIDQRREGLFHVTDAGVASWYDFAEAIAEEALAAGWLSARPRLIPVCTELPPKGAPRPACSLLDKRRTWEVLGEAAPHWRIALRAIMAEARSG